MELLLKWQDEKTISSLVLHLRQHRLEVGFVTGCDYKPKVVSIFPFVVMVNLGVVVDLFCDRL